MKRVAVVSLLLLLPISLLAADTLRVVSAGPVGEVASLAEANEVRIVFSEPMVVVGRIPDPVTAPWFRIEPAVPGTFRWSGTTTLIFTPDAKRPLPYATKFDVTIERTARSVAGNTLDRTYRFSFTTPSVRLLSTNWYRKGVRFDGPVVIGLRFNQPVNGNAVLSKLELRTASHEFRAPVAPQTPSDAFQAKLAKARASAGSEGTPVFAFLTNEWETSRLGSGSDLVVLETKPNIPTDTWIKVQFAAQEYTIQLDPTLFVAALSCIEKCDPENSTYLEFRSSGLPFQNVVQAVRVFDITDPAREVRLQPQPRSRDYDYPSSGYTLDDLGFAMQPARTYRVVVDSSLTAADGQKLGYTWDGKVEFWHSSAFISFGDGQGVWESSGGPILPFHSRNLRSVKQWLAPLGLDRLVPTIVAQMSNGFRSVPPDGKPQDRTLRVIPDKIQSFGLDVSSAIGSDNRGLLWAAMQPGTAIEKAGIYDPAIRATIVQVTNLGLSVKDSPLNTLIFVTRLDNGAPVAGAKVSIRTTDNKVFWTGTTDEKGLALAPNTSLRWKPQPADDYDASWRALSDLHFIVVAEKDGDVAYVGSDWNEGVMPWELGVNFEIQESNPTLRGTVFTDRGVYKLGEEVHAKVVLRTDTPTGMQLLPAGTKVEAILRDSQDKEVQKQSLTLNEWSSAEWVFKVPTEAPLGTYTIHTTVEGQRLRITGNFLVAAYRRPDFRVDVTLGGGTIAGQDLEGTISARYLHGGAMGGKDVKWTYTRRPAWDVPSAILNRWPAERFTFLGWNDAIAQNQVTISTEEEELDAKGDVKLTLKTDESAGWPFDYRLEGEVTDVTRQRIANRATQRVHPASFYIGVKNPPYFAEAAKGVDTEVVAAGLDGAPVAGVTVNVSLLRIQWNSVRQAIGNGFYEWQTERKEIPAGQWTVTTASQPAPLHIPLKEGGEYRLEATATDAEGRSTSTRMWFYAIGEGYTAWERYDHNRIDLVPEKKNYKPGETARIMIKSPWERATALLTTEREGVRSQQQFELTSTQQTVSVPITERDIPNVFVSVLLVKGRTQEAVTEDASDPGKPSFRLGYVELNVEDASKRLKVDVDADRDEFRPATKARIEVNVKDVAGKPVQSEVTLWAVDYGVLSLTAYETPDVLQSIYLRKALQVVNEDSRQRIVSRRVLTPKGAEEGGGGGADTGPGTLRKDFRVLAFWVGSIVTDARGRARTEITLPESLTTYRIMAVAGDRASRFGWAQDEIKINKPLMLTPAFPRFMTPGDQAHFGGVVYSQVKKAGRATVTIRSLDPSVIEISGDQTIDVRPGSSSEVRFDATAKAVGTARIQMSVKMGRETDAFEDVIPVRVLVSPETVSASGEAKPRATETIEVPANVVPGFGGLRLQLSSTAMVGLAEGASYLVQYPYGCAEQRASGALALVLTSDLGEAFKLPGIEAGKNREIAQATLRELETFQCGDGGFAYWPGSCWSVSPYLTSYVVHVMQVGKKLGYAVNEDTLRRAYEYLTRNLNEPRPTNEGWWPAYTSWQAFAVKVLAQGGVNVDSHVNRLYGYIDRMPIFGISYLADAMVAKGEKGQRVEELHRRITNAILPEGSSAHVEELNDPYLLWFWNSNVRSTAIALGTLVRQGGDEQIVKRMVRWLMGARKNGRWGNTQENAWAMESLIDYYRKYEAEVPDFTGIVNVGNETIAREEFRGRSTEARVREFGMGQVKGGAVTFERQGTGTLFYLMRLRYASLERNLQAMNQGFHIERTYSTGTTFKAGDLIRVTIKVRNTKERRYVAITDPIPAGTEPVETSFATTASELVEEHGSRQVQSWMSWYQRGGWDHEERHDDRVNVFATRLAEGEHEYTYMLRATTAGTFLTAPTHIEEMYEPEVFGRTASVTVEVQK